MVIDDDPMVRTVLGSMLEYFEWLVTTVANAEEAFALLDRSPAPAVLITDVDLGLGMNGFHFCTIARQRWPETGIVVISGRPPCAKQLETLGAREIFLPKPVTLSVLETALASVCNRS